MNSQARRDDGLCEAGVRPKLGRFLGCVPRFYPTDLLPTMQGLLAAVADLETRYEIDREQIEQGAGSEEDKERRLAELRADHEHRRGLHEARWAELHPGGHCTHLRPPI